MCLSRLIVCRTEHKVNSYLYSVKLIAPNKEYWILCNNVSTAHSCLIFKVMFVVLILKPPFLEHWVLRYRHFLLSNYRTLCISLLSTVFSSLCLLRTMTIQIAEPADGLKVGVPQHTRALFRTHVHDFYISGTTCFVRQFNQDCRRNTVLYLNTANLHFKCHVIQTAVWIVHSRNGINFLIFGNASERIS